VIKVTRFNGAEYFLNSDLIETIEETPDTVITMVDDKKLIVKESSTEIVKRIIEYNREIFLEKKRIK